MRSWSLAMLLLIALGGLNFAFSQETPDAIDEADANQASNSDAGGIMLAFRQTVETVHLKDGTRVPILSNSMKGSKGKMDRAYHFPIPVLTVEDGKFYDSESKSVTFDISFEDRSEEISQKIKSETLEGVPLVELPINGYEISISTGGYVEVLESTVTSKREYVFSGAYTCTGTIKTPEIIQALEKNPNIVTIVIRLNSGFKRENGSNARISMEASFKQQFEENVFGTHGDNVIMSSKCADELFRKATNEIESCFSQGSAVEFRGPSAPEIEKIIQIFMERNKDLFVEKTLSDFQSYNESLLLYTPEFGICEIQPDVKDDIVKAFEETNETKTHLLEQIGKLRDIAKSSSDFNSFMEKVSSSKEVSAGASYCGIGASGSYKTSNSKENASQRAHAQEMFEKLKDDSLKVEDVYNLASKRISGEMKTFFTSPKTYKVVRLSRSKLRELTEFYCSKTTLVSFNDSCVFPITIKNAMFKKHTLEYIESLEAANQELTNSNEVMDAQVQRMTTEIDRLNKVIDALIKEKQ